MKRFQLLCLFLCLSSCHVSGKTTETDAANLQLLSQTTLDDSGFEKITPDTCVLFYVPRAARGVLTIEGLQGTEFTTNLLIIDKVSQPLPVTQDRLTQASATFTYPLNLQGGPHEVCLKGGIRLDDFANDAFSFSAVRLSLTGVKASEVQIRKIP